MRFWVLILALVLAITAGAWLGNSAWAEGTSRVRSIPVQLAQEAGDDLDCEDFETQEDAQAVLTEDPADPNNLDPNGDGIACALLPAAADVDASAEGNAEAEQDTGDTEQTQEERRAARR